MAQKNKFTRDEIRTLYKSIESMHTLQGAKFLMFVIENLNKMQTEINELNALIEMPAEFVPVHEKRIALAEKYAKKDENGTPITENGAYQLENTTAFTEEFKKLQEDHKELFDKRIKQEREFVEMLKTTSAVVPIKIHVNDIPNTITLQQLVSIYPLIEK